MENVDGLRRLIEQAGIMTAAELLQAEAFHLRAMGHPEGPARLVYRNPMVLAGAPGMRPPAALVWRWETERADDFCRWATQVLRERFGLDMRIAPAASPEGSPPEYLEVRGGGREEVCAWSRLNRDRWMGAFCVIVNRVLEPLGVLALALDADEDVVLCFCLSSYAEALAQRFPEA